MAILSKSSGGWIHARCAACSREYFLHKKKDIANFYQYRKKFRKDLCSICRAAQELGHYEYECAGCGKIACGASDDLRDCLNVHNRAMCRSCMEGYYGPYNENNKALMIALEVIEKKTFRKAPRNYKKFHEYREAESDYYRVVRNKTRCIYKAHKRIVNPNNRFIAPSGVKGAHQVDHIVSVSLCFMCNVPTDFASAFENLQIVPWYINIIRGDLQKGKMKKK